MQCAQKIQGKDMTGTSSRHGTDGTWATLIQMTSLISSETCVRSLRVSETSVNLWHLSEVDDDSPALLKLINVNKKQDFLGICFVVDKKGGSINKENNLFYSKFTNE